MAHNSQLKNAICFENVSKNFYGTSGKVQKVLDKVNFTIPKGKITVIAGGSGQGKSVTLKLILGLLEAEQGKIIVNGLEVGLLDDSELQNLRTQFGVLFQGSALFDSLSVFDNVALPLQERTQKTDVAITQAVMTTLQQLGLEGHESKFPAQLSGGMKKRVGLARALQLNPEIVLFDEPTTGLDPLMTQEIYKLFQKTQQRLGYTGVIVSHDIPGVFELADQIIILNNGVVELFSSLKELQQSKQPAIQKFIAMTMGDLLNKKGKKTV